MKIWYQSYTQIGFDPKWKNIENEIGLYVRKVARPDTQVDIHGVEKMSSKMTESDYIQFLHLSQVVENGLRAEREGYDAFCLGGTLDLGHMILREVLDIPVAFILESSLYNACLFARKFGIISLNERMLQKQIELVRFYGMEERIVPSEHLGYSMMDVLNLSEKKPQWIIDAFSAKARKVIARGAGVLIPGFGPLSSFFGQRGFHDVDGIPIVDIIASLIKTAEMLVDLKLLGVKRNRKGFYTYASKKELLAARKQYGIE